MGWVGEGKLYISICGAIMGMDDLRHISAQLRSMWRVCICLEQVGSIYKDALSGGYRTECGRILDMKLIASA